MKRNRGIALLLAVVLSFAFLATGCFGGEPQSSQVVLEAPPTPQNLKATADNGTIHLSWSPSPGATGYVISLYDKADQMYQDIAHTNTTMYTYTPESKQQVEFRFGVYAIAEGGGQKLYSPQLTKVTVLTEQEKVTLDQKKLTLNPKKTATLKATVTPKETTVGLYWESEDENIATVNSDGKVTGVSVGTTKISAVTTNGTRAACSVTVTEPVKVPSGKLIAVTFDDGPSAANTGRLLDALKKYDSHATFFMVGPNVGGNASIVKRMKDEGHELGNHSWNHPQLTELSGAKIDKELNDTANAVYDASGAYPTVFRAPYGALNSKVLSHLETPSILWSVDTLDWKYRDAKYVKKQILNSAYDGAVILLHDIHKTSVDGFIAALPKLKEKGYTLVTVTELLSRNGKVPQAGVSYSEQAPY